MNSSLRKCSVVITAMLLLGCSIVTAAESNTVILTAASDSVDPTEFMEYFVDPEGTLTASNNLEMDFSAIESGGINFGFTSDKIWLRFEVRNSSPQVINKLLATQSRFMRPLEIYQIHNDSSIDRLLFNDETQKFGERPIPELRFLAVEFSLDAFESSVFLIRFGAGGQASMNFEIRSREVALAEQYRATVGISIYISVLLALILVNFFHYLAVRQIAYLVYVFYESLNLIYVSHMEGFTWQYLWPNLPQLNADATPAIAAMGLVMGNVFGMVFLQSWKYAPRLHKVLLFFLALSAITLLITLFFSNRLGNQLTAPLLPICMLLNVIIAAVSIRGGHYLARYFFVAWSMFAVMAAIWSGTILGFVSVDFNILTVYKVVIAAQAFILSMGLADQVRRLNNQYVQSQSSLIESLQGRLNDAKERVLLERKNEDTMLQLLQKSKLLATTSHDINQPLQSLRIALSSLSKESIDVESTKRLGRTLDHMESVLGTALDDASDDLKKTAEHTAARSILAGSLVAEVIAAFYDQAEEKGLNLRAHKSEIIVVTRVVPLKRCLMNLVSNAIQATDKGGILLGVRRSGEKVAFQVFDTGRGIAEDSIEDSRQLLAQGSDSTGHGLGLAIASEICEEYGWELAIKSVVGRGSKFEILIPARV